MAIVPDHIKSAFNYIWKKFSTWRWWSVIIPLLIATIIAAISFYFKVGDFWYNKLATYKFWLSGTFIGSGCFAVFFKIFLFNGVIQEIFMGEIFNNKLDKLIKKQFDETILSEKYNSNLIQTFNSVIYDRKYLQKDKNLENIWREETTCFIKDEFPEIEDKVLNKIQNVYFKTSSLSYYFKDRHEKYQISTIDNKYIELLINSKYEIKRLTTDEFVFEVKYCVDKDIYEDLESVIDIRAVYVNNKKIENLNEYITEENKISENVDEKRIFKNLDLPLKGNKSYPFQIATLLRFPYIDEFDSFDVSFKRIVDGLSIEFFCKDNAIFNLSEFGLEKFKENDISIISSGKIYHHNEIILPEQGGYKINFKLLKQL